MRNGNDMNSDQLSLNDKKMKLEGKIGYWKVSFDLLTSIVSKKKTKNFKNLEEI